MTHTHTHTHTQWPAIVELWHTPVRTCVSQYYCDNCILHVTHIWMSHGLLCHIYEWIMVSDLSHTQMSHGLSIHIFKICLIHKWVMVSHVAYLNKSLVCPNPIAISVTWLIHMCDTTHSYMRHDLFICFSWLIHTCDMTHSYVWHDSFICVH